MKKFDESYILLQEMYDDDYFPKKCVDRVRNLLFELIKYLESGEHSLIEIQKQLDIMTIGINNLQEMFEENDSEIETAARDCIGTTVEYILNYFNIDIDIENAIQEREW